MSGNDPELTTKAVKPVVSARHRPTISEKIDAGCNVRIQYLLMALSGQSRHGIDLSAVGQGRTQVGLRKPDPWSLCFLLGSFVDFAACVAFDDKRVFRRVHAADE